MSVAVFRDALATALVVGPILVAINHGDRLMSGAPLPWLKISLTFLVPFLVASFAGWRATQRRRVTS